MRRTPAVSIRRNRAAAGKSSSSSGRLASADRSAGTRNRLDQPEVSERKARRFGVAFPDQHLSPARRGASGRRGDDAFGRLRRVRELDPFAVGTGVPVRLQPEGLGSDSQRVRRLHRDLVAADAGRPVLWTVAAAVGNPRLHGQLERAPAPHPGQVPRVDGPERDAERRVAEDRPFEARLLQVAEKGRHVEERRLPAGVRSDEDMERSEPLRHVAQGPEPERLDARHDHVRWQWYTPGATLSARVRFRVANAPDGGAPRKGGGLPAGL